MLAQQVMFTRWNLGRAAGLGIPVFNMDAWDGYVAARQRLLDFLAARTPANPVILTGDIHSAWAANILENFDDPGAGIVAAEFVGTSITSDFPRGPHPGGAGHAARQPPHPLLRRAAPRLRALRGHAAAVAHATTAASIRS